MSTSKLMKVTYYDPKSQIRLLCYADTVSGPGQVLLFSAGAQRQSQMRRLRRPSVVSPESGCLA